MRTIRITGRGQIKVHPDMTRITMTMEGITPEYAETLRRSSEDTETLKGVLEPFGFSRTDLKTLRFDVSPEFESYRQMGTYKQRLTGYRYEHVLKLEFASDNARLGKILYALSGCALRPRFQISYTVKDPEAAKNELLGKAVRDAREKADVLTGAAGVSLKEIQSVDYSWGEIRFECSPMNRELRMDDTLCAPSAAESFAMDIEPDDIDVTDTVTVVWEIA